MIDAEMLLRVDASFSGGPDAVFAAIAEIPCTHQEEQPTSPKDDMDTLGSLVDKLCTVSMKMWHNQEHLYAIRRMSKDAFVDTYGQDLAGLHDIVRRCCDLNVQRASLIDEIDKFLASAVGGRTDLVREQHKTY